MIRDEVTCDGRVGTLGVSPVGFGGNPPGRGSYGRSGAGWGALEYERRAQRFSLRFVVGGSHEGGECLVTHSVPNQETSFFS